MRDVSNTFQLSQAANNADFNGAPDSNMKPVLLRISTDLFLSKRMHSAEEIDQFEEIAQHLISTVEMDALLPIAKKLARHPQTPLSIVQALLKRGGAAGAIVFQHALQLDQSTLINIAKWGEHSQAMAIAQRALFDDALTRALCERPEDDVVVALLENPATTFDNATIAYLMRRARRSPMLAQAMAARTDLITDMTPLFLWSPAATRRDVILAARRSDLGDKSRYKPHAGETAAHLKLERLALARQTPAFEEALAEELHISMEMADMLMQDESGESLAIALATLAVPAETAARIFMMADPAIAHSVDVVRELTQLVHVLHPRTARRLAVAMLGVPPVIPARPLYATNAANPLPSRSTSQGLSQAPAKQPAVEVIAFQPRKLSA